MNLSDYSRKDIGALGEKVVAEYLRRLRFSICGMNIRAFFGELDIVATRDRCMHIIEVKSLKCLEFPESGAYGADAYGLYDPGQNLHRNKVRKVIRMAEWYTGSVKWEGEWQVDGALVWLRERDGIARVKYYPQIL